MSIRRLFLAGSIDLTALCPSLQIQHLDPKFQPFAKQGRNGRVYLNVAFGSKREESKFGHTHNLMCQEKGKSPIYIGDFKDYTPNWEDTPQAKLQQQSVQQAQPIQQPVNTSVVDTDSLPF